MSNGRNCYPRSMYQEILNIDVAGDRIWQPSAQRGGNYKCQSDGFVPSPDIFRRHVWRESMYQEILNIDVAGDRIWQPSAQRGGNYKCHSDGFVPSPDIFRRHVWWEYPEIGFGSRALRGAEIINVRVTASFRPRTYLGVTCGETGDRIWQPSAQRGGNYKCHSDGFVPSPDIFRRHVWWEYPEIGFGSRALRGAEIINVTVTASFRPRTYLGVTCGGTGDRIWQLSAQRGGNYKCHRDSFVPSLDIFRRHVWWEYPEIGFGSRALRGAEIINVTVTASFRPRTYLGVTCGGTGDRIWQLSAQRGGNYKCHSDSFVPSPDIFSRHVWREYANSYRDTVVPEIGFGSRALRGAEIINVTVTASFRPRTYLVVTWIESFHTLIAPRVIAFADAQAIT
ncbi:hypothetical protein J6590_068114 [Homalodisca vitripennis]|nr:hypothetical protein J6590_068114 [Homalodisca vitripennis]